MSTTVMALEGVLCGRHDEPVDLVTEQPVPAALALFHGLQRTGKIVLASSQERRLVEHWCRNNGISGYASVVPLNERSVTSLRANGEDVGLYIDADPERAAGALRHGVPTLLFTRPLYARAGHRPDLPQLQRPWASVVAEAKAQRSARGAHVPADTTHED